MVRHHLRLDCNDQGAKRLGTKAPCALTRAAMIEPKDGRWQMIPHADGRTAWPILLMVCMMLIGRCCSGVSAQAVETPVAAEDSAETAAETSSEATAASDASKDSSATAPPSTIESAVEPDEEYYELLKLFADTLDQVERNYVEEVSRRELMEAAIKGVLAKLDQYSDYIPPDQFDNFRTGVENQFGGIGIRVGVIDGKLTVITPLIGTPAYRAGILTGDHIVAIADESTDGMSLEDAIARMKGPIGTTVKIRVRHKDDNVEEQVTVERQLVKMETVLSDRRQADDAWDFMFDKEKKIGYVRITSFSGHTAEDLQLALERLQADGMKSLILDLRFNPGGLLSSAIEVADLFLTEGTIVSTAGRNTDKRVWEAKEPGTFQGFDIVVLVNRYSASASEIIAACLQDHQRATIIGERTWGKGSVQNIIELEGGRSALKLTTAGYMRPSGKNIHRNDDATEDDDWGVRPDEGFEVEMRVAEIRRLLAYQRDRDVLLTPAEKKADPDEAYVDRQLEKALEHLTKSE